MKATARKCPEMEEDLKMGKSWKCDEALGGGRESGECGLEGSLGRD